MFEAAMISFSMSLSEAGLLIHPQLGMTPLPNGAFCWDMGQAEITPEKEPFRRDMSGGCAGFFLPCDVILYSLVPLFH